MEAVSVRRARAAQPRSAETLLPILPLISAVPVGYVKRGCDPRSQLSACAKLPLVSLSQQSEQGSSLPAGLPEALYPDTPSKGSVVIRQG